MQNDKTTLSCLSCGLREGDITTPKMMPYGEGKKGILVIGEAPGRVEDMRGKPWQGKTGSLLKNMLGNFEIDLFQDCVSVNALNCRPPNNRAPTPFEVNCCREVLVRDTIQKVKPRVILLLGSSAVMSFLGDRWKNDLGGIMKWRGFTIPDKDYNAWVLPTFHPSFIARSESEEVETVWKNDLSLLTKIIGKKIPSLPKPDIQVLEDLSILNQIKGVDSISFDFETNGLKPQQRGMRIICVSVAPSEEKVYVFMLPKTQIERKPLLDLLTDNTIGKMAHNAKFEDNWTNERLKVSIKNWQWDSMLAAHLLDNRTGVTGLKFQTYVNFGVVDYASEITPYLSSSGGSNDFNNIQKLLEEIGGEQKLLTYSALDSHYEYLLAKKQMKELNYNFLPF